MYNISCNQSEPYGDVIASFIKREFPILVRTNDSALLDLLTEAIVSSGQVRFGPKPSPESLVAIRQVITHYTAQNRPIPFLMAWGSEKPDGSGVDIAELFALKTLDCLNKRVVQFYPAGVRINIRVEDASAPHLFFDNMDKARRDAAIYTQGFVNLAKVIGTSDFISVRPESTMTSEEAFNARADIILPAMVKHVLDPLDAQSAADVRGYGWSNPLTPETLNWYLERYAKLYPDKTPAEQRYILARYFAGACARYSLGIRGDDAAWGGTYLELSFTAPTVGISAARAQKRLYYRTMPSAITSNHMAPWRAKGYLRVGEETSASLASFYDTSLSLNQNTITISDGQVSQEIRADYTVVA